MASAMPAYRLDTYPDYSPDSSPRRGVRAYRTSSPSDGQAASLLVLAAKMAAVLLLVVAGLCFARIALTSASVTTMIESDTLSAQIADARSSGIALEMEQSVLANANAINANAKKLGMAAPAAVSTISLTPDVVAVSEEGSLSLSGSVNNLIELQG